MSEDFPFLNAIFSRPHDDGLRLVYADWLEDRGDPRASFVRLEVEQHRAAKNDRKLQAALAQQISNLRPTPDAQWVVWMRRTRDLSPGVRSELVTVKDGKGLIEVRGGDDDTLLLVEGRPVAFNWNDCQGSIGQYLVFTGHTRGADYARQVAWLVEGNVDLARPLAEQIEPLLSVCASGTYWLTYVPSNAVESVATFEYAEVSGYYPADDHNLVCTQTSESLNDSRVAFYRDQIQAGRRPIVLSVSADGAWCEFVIDGHHKLAAYNREKVRPTVLGIVRLQAPAISLAEGLTYLPAGHPGYAEYRRMKKYAAT